MPAHGRLRAREDFDRVFREGRAVVTPLMVVRAVRSGVGDARVGFAVSRHLGGAVVRNRLRRRWREVVRRGPPIRPGWDVVVVARSGSRTAGWAGLVQAWQAALGRGGLVAVPRQDVGPGR